MSQFHILADHEIKKFTQPPQFDKNSRMAAFSLNESLKRALKGLKRSPENKVGFMLQAGYFKATLKFYSIDKFRNADVYYVSKQLHPKQIMLSVIDILTEKKIATPSYDYFCKVITSDYRNFENDLIKSLKNLMLKQHKNVLDELLDEGDHNQHKLLTSLKVICQSTAKGKIKKSLHRYLILKRTHEELEVIINKLDLT